MNKPLPESRDERSFYLVVLQQQSWILIKINREQLAKFWHFYMTELKNKGERKE